LASTSQREATCIAWLVAWDRGRRRHRSRGLSPRIAYPGDKASGLRRHVTFASATSLAMRGDRERRVGRRGSPDMSPVLANTGDKDRDARRHAQRRQATGLAEHVAWYRLVRRQRSRWLWPRRSSVGDEDRRHGRHTARDVPTSSATDATRTEDGLTMGVGALNVGAAHRRPTVHRRVRRASLLPTALSACARIMYRGERTMVRAATSSRARATRPSRSRPTAALPPA
jgi:hypothetical protein